MGALLDSTFLIEAERVGLPPAAVLIEAQKLASSNQLGISVISIMEMAHGEARAESSSLAKLRERFLGALLSALEIYPVTPEIAMRAGHLDGDLSKQGNKLAFPDLIIGVTALDLGYSVITRNLRHFRRIPGLDVFHHGRSA